MEDILGESTSDRRFHMVLFGGFAGLAMLLAAAGLYGVLSYGVSRRRGEIGLRLALGASGSDVRRLILRDGMRPALWGIVMGLPRRGRRMPIAEEPVVRYCADGPVDLRRCPVAAPRRLGAGELYPRAASGARRPDSDAAFRVSR